MDWWLTPDETSDEGCYDNAQFAPSKALKGKSIKRPSESTSMKDWTLAIQRPIGITSGQPDDSKKFEISESMKNSG